MDGDVDSCPEKSPDPRVLIVPLRQFGVGELKVPTCATCALCVKFNGRYQVQLAKKSTIFECT